MRSLLFGGRYGVALDGGAQRIMAGDEWESNPVKPWREKLAKVGLCALFACVLKKEKNMAHKTKTVAREMVEKAGVDVDKLLDLLVRNASAELTTYYYYTILRTNLIGFEGEGLKEIVEDARIEDRNHFEALVPITRPHFRFRPLAADV